MGVIRIFVFLGVTGVLLAIVVKLVIREPVRGAMEFNDQREIAKRFAMTAAHL